MQGTVEEQIAEICQKENIPSPLEFLTQIMNGKDPRRISEIYRLVLYLEDEYGEDPPDIWDWLELTELIKREYRFSIVEIGKSQDAAKQLMEYTHPKRKSVEKTVTNKASEASEITRKEARILKKVFELEY